MIREYEKKITELTGELENPETYDDPARAMTINRELTQAPNTLDSLTPEWEAAVEKLEQIS